MLWLYEFDQREFRPSFDGNYSKSILFYKEAFDEF